MSNSFQPDILVLCCGSALAAGSLLPEGYRNEEGFRARFVRLPCGSKLESVNLVKLIERGIDGVVVITCPEGACRSIFGSARAGNRVRYAATCLEEAGIGAARLGVVHGQGLGEKEMIAVAEERARAVHDLGPNPMKLEVDTIAGEEYAR
ncbi:MAG: hydrogenase iron-sulfur subunit [Dehalococcoidia bacterium]|nr:hydrogenase iron-sulfur subunit [Dehalococcoidia bacterium]